MSHETPQGSRLKAHGSEIISQFAAAQWMAQAAQGAVFDLADALAGEAELLAHLFEGVAFAIDQAEAQPDERPIAPAAFAAIELADAEIDTADIVGVEPPPFDRKTDPRDAHLFSDEAAPAPAATPPASGASLTTRPMVS